MDFDIAALPLAKTLGVELTVAEKDRVVGQLTVREELTTGGHILHGGAYMAFADSLGAIGARAEPARGHADDDAGEQDQLPRQRPGRRDHHRARRRRCTSAAAPASGRPGDSADPTQMTLELGDACGGVGCCAAAASELAQSRTMGCLGRALLRGCPGSDPVSSWPWSRL